MIPLTKKARHQRLAKWFLAACVTKDLHENNGANGGFLVPPELALGMDELIQEENWFLRHATVFPVNGVELRVPIPDVTQGATNVSPLFGGFQMYWIKDGVAPTESEAQFTMARMKTRNLAGFGYISNQLIDDGGEQLGAYLENVIARAVSFYSQLAFFIGDSTNPAQPLGLTNSPCAKKVTRNTATSVVAADIASMLLQLLPASFPHAWWCCSPGAYGQLSGLSGFFPALTDEVGVMGTMRGLPIFVTECLPQLGTLGDLTLVDPRYFIIAQRDEIEIAWAKDYPTAYAVNQSVLRAWWRVDGQMAWPTTATTASGLTGVSPLVLLN